MKINHLTPSEEILMSILWKLDCAYMKDVIAHYPEPKPHQNTISTFIKILVEKEFLTTEKEGRIPLLFSDQLPSPSHVRDICRR
jgi:BlaI family penicillinase repressor